MTNYSSYTTRTPVNKRCSNSGIVYNSHSRVIYNFTAAVSTTPEWTETTSQSVYKCSRLFIFLFWEQHIMECLLWILLVQTGIEKNPGPWFCSGSQNTIHHRSVPVRCNGCRGWLQSPEKQPLPQLLIAVIIPGNPVKCGIFVVEMLYVYFPPVNSCGPRNLPNISTIS